MNFSQFYGCKYSKLIQIIYTQLYGLFLFNNHLLLHNYMVLPNTNNLQAFISFQVTNH